MNKEHLQNIVEETIRDMGLFLVDCSIDSQNIIEVYIDSDQGVSIDQCVEVNRKLEQRLDRDTEDYSLEVSSPGLDTPFKVFPQYRKNLGREVAVVTLDGEKYKGVLTGANDSGITLEYTKKEKQKGQKKTLKTKIARDFSFDEIKSTKVVIKI